jgi:hypothetical protein
MKTFILCIILIAGLSVGCSEKQDPTNQGCLTGVNSDGNRVLIRCCTKDQYLAGSNVNAGGTAIWPNYSGHKWESCQDCK